MLLVWQLLMRSHSQHQPLPQHQPQQCHRWFPMVWNCRKYVASPVLLLHIFSAKNLETRNWRYCVLAWLGWIEASFLIYVFVGMLFLGNWVVSCWICFMKCRTWVIVFMCVLTFSVWSFKYFQSETKLFANNVVFLFFLDHGYHPILLLLVFLLMVLLAPF